MKSPRIPNLVVAMLASASLLSIAGAARAGEGVYEINQTCAVETGCFPGDGPGLPVTILATTPGTSFRLTSDLRVPDANTDGIEIWRSDVALDLGGFAVIREDCFTTAFTCTVQTGSGDGVLFLAGTGRNSSSVRNGSVVGMGANGVYLQGGADRIEGVAVRNCGGRGIRTGSGSLVRDNLVLGNGGDGIELVRAVTVEGNVVRLNGGAGLSTGILANGVTVLGNTVSENVGNGIETGNGATVERNTVFDNGGSGIEAGTGSTLRGNSARDNGSSGIEAGTGSTLSGNTVSGNAASGFFLSVGTTVTGNTAYQNGGDGIFTSSGATIVDNTSYDNNGDGIEAGTDSLVQRNTSRLNGGTGLRLGAGSGYRANVVNDNTLGTLTGGLNLGDNVCNASTTCP